MNQYRDQEDEKSREENSFSRMLASERTKKQSVSSEPKEEKLRMMDGLNQYNRQAMEVYFILSRKTDYLA